MQIETEPIVTHLDDRGALVKAWPHSVSGEVYLVELRPGTSRGHHFHRAGAEWFVPVVGCATLVVEDPETGARARVVLDGLRARVPAGMAHAIFGPADATVWVMAVADSLPDQLDTSPYRVNLE